MLTQDYIELVWAFRLTFAVDACRGLAFLHSKKILHGRLSSTNCVIDNRWTLKLTGVIQSVWLYNVGVCDVQILSTSGEGPSLDFFSHQIDFALRSIRNSKLDCSSESRKVGNFNQLALAVPL